MTRTTLVTGASTGIGATYARHLAKRGHDLIIVARDQQRLETLSDRLHLETGQNIEVLQADLTVPEELLVVEERLRNDAAIEMLVNNAGASLPYAVLGTDPDRMVSVIELNVIAFTRLAAAAANTFAKRGAGTIVNISSGTVVVPERYGAVYTGTKAYILAFTQALQAEIGKCGVQVQAVLPGMVLTEIWERSGKDPKALNPNHVMDVDEFVAAALAGLDRGELVTITTLPDIADWDALTTARQKVESQRLSSNHAAARYHSPSGSSM